MRITLVVKLHEKTPAYFRIFFSFQRKLLVMVGKCLQKLTFDVTNSIKITIFSGWGRAPNRECQQTKTREHQFLGDP